MSERRGSTSPGSSSPSSVLFVCGLNAIRSPMAENLAKRLLGTAMFIQSAGVEAGDRDLFAEEVMGELGLDISTHKPTMLDDLDDSYFDLIITLAPEAHHRALQMAGAQAVEVEYWPTMDPSAVAGSRGQILEAYRQTRDYLEARIRARFGIE